MNVPGGLTPEQAAYFQQQQQQLLIQQQQLAHQQAMLEHQQRAMSGGMSAATTSTMPGAVMPGQMVMPGQVMPGQQPMMMGTPTGPMMPQAGMMMMAPQPTMVVQMVQAPTQLLVKDVDLRSFEANVTFVFKGCRNLAMQGSSVPNPYVKLFDGQKKLAANKYVSKSLNPDFVYEAFVVDQRDASGDYRFEVWSSCTFVDDFLGFVAIKKESVLIGAESTTEFQLLARPDHKSDKVSGTLIVNIKAERKPMSQIMNESISSLSQGNILFVNLNPGVSAQHIFGVVQSIGTQAYFRVSQPNSTSMVLSKTEEFTRVVTDNVSVHSNNYGYGHGHRGHSHGYQTAQVSHTERWTEEFNCTFGVYATSQGQMYLQVQYSNPKGHDKFKQNWKLIGSSVIQSMVASQLCNQNPAFKTFVLSTDGAAAGGCCIV